jgi:hypothetical protein
MMATPEKRNPGAVGAAAGANVDCDINSDDLSEVAAASLAVCKIADRYHLSLAVAGVVCTLAGIGDRSAA